MIIKINVPRTLPVRFHKLSIPRRPLVLCVSGQHGLQTHAHAFDVLHGRPAGGAEEVETDYAVAVDVGVHGDVAGWGDGEDECYFWWLCWRKGRQSMCEVGDGGGV